MDMGIGLLQKLILRQPFKKQKGSYHNELAKEVFEK